MNLLPTVLLLCPLSAFALTGEQMKSLQDAVKEMCLYPDRAGVVVKLEGDAKAGLPVPVKIVKAELSGKLSFEAWKGIPITLDKYKTDPRQCSIEMVKLLLPTFQPAAEEKTPKLVPTLNKSSSLRFENEGGPIFNPYMKAATWMRAAVKSGPGCASVASSSREILWSPATFGMNPQGDSAPFSYESGQAYEWAQSIADSLAKRASVSRNCTSASFETLVRISFDDARGASFVRHYRIATSSDEPPTSGSTALSVALPFDEANQVLESAKAQNKPVTLPLALESLLLAVVPR